MKSMKSICIVPARGGSKRIPHKNITDFMGMPLIAWSIRAALNSGCFDEVMVSTDSEEIADIAKQYGANVPFLRSAETANDYATTADVIEEVLNRYEEQGKHFDAFCCLYATAPFVMPFRLHKAAEIISDDAIDGAFTVVAFSYPPQRGLRVNEAGCVEMLHPEYAKTRSQDLPTIYHDAGQFYFCKTEAFKREHTLWCRATAPIILSEEEAQDIDTYSDLKIAKEKARNMIFKERMQSEHYTFINYSILDENLLAATHAERNRPAVRCQMVNDQEIPFENHRRFAESMRNRLDYGYYAVVSGEGRGTRDEGPGTGNRGLIGVINAQMLDDGVAERGIFMAEKYQGKGLAKSIVTEFYDLLRRERNIHTIITKVKVDNEASNALERSLGATLTGKAQKLNVFELKIEN
jgi:N-acylneuraminate cytidylyltransferase